MIRAIQSLDARERQQVREALDRDWAQDLDSLLREVRTRYEATPMTEDEITTEIEAARVEYHARRRWLVVPRATVAIEADSTCRLD